MKVRLSYEPSSRSPHPICGAAHITFDTASTFNLTSEAGPWTCSRDLSSVFAVCITCCLPASSAARPLDLSKARCSSCNARKQSLKCRTGRICCRLDGRYSNIHSGPLGNALEMAAEPPASLQCNTQAYCLACVLMFRCVCVLV